MSGDGSCASAWEGARECIVLRDGYLLENSHGNMVEDLVFPTNGKLLGFPKEWIGMMRL